MLAHAERPSRARSLGLELGLMALSVGGAIGSWFLAKRRYGADRSPDWAAGRAQAPRLPHFQNKYYVDRDLPATMVRWFMGLRLVFAEMDRWIVDGLVNGIGVAVAVSASSVNGAIDAYIVDGAVNFVAKGTLNAGDKLRTVQTGRIRELCLRPPRRGRVLRHRPVLLK